MAEYKWRCAKPTCGQEWTSTGETAPYGTRARCACGTATVPLQCPHCRLKLVTPEAALSPARQEDFLGGTQRACLGPTCQRAFRVPVSEIELRERIALLGGSEVGGERGRFSQRVRAAALPKSLEAQVPDGYCAGMCLDWIRRVLQGGRATYEVSPYDGRANRMRTRAELTARETAQSVRGATGWVTRFGAARDDFKAAARARHLDELQPVQAARDEADSAWDILDSEYRALVAVYKNCTYAAEQVPLKPRLLEVKQAWEDAGRRYKELCGEADRLVAANNAQVAKPELERFWTTYARLMDGFSAAERAREGRAEATKRPFSALHVVVDVPSTELNSVRLCADAPIGHAEFTPTRAAYLGFDSYVKAQGHAVAVHRLRTGGKYHLFDPNLGTFEFDSTGLVGAIEVLFATFYQGYTNNAKAKVGFTIFSHAREGEPIPSVLKLGPTV